MITPQAAQEKALSPEFKTKGEMIYYQMLVAYLDYYLVTHFNGQDDLLIKLTSEILFKYNNRLDFQQLTENSELKYEEKGRFSSSFYSIQQLANSSHLKKMCNGVYGSWLVYIKETSVGSYNFSIQKEKQFKLFNWITKLNIF